MIDHLMYDIIEFFDSTLESGELPGFSSRPRMSLQLFQAEESKARHPEGDDPESSHLLTNLSLVSSVIGILDTPSARSTPTPAPPMLADTNRGRTSSSRMTAPRRDAEYRAYRVAHQHQIEDRSRTVEDRTSRHPPTYHEAIGLPHRSKSWHPERITEAPPPSSLPPSHPSRWNPIRASLKGLHFGSRRTKSSSSSTLRVVTMPSTTGRTAVAVLPKH